MKIFEASIFKNWGVGFISGLILIAFNLWLAFHYGIGGYILFMTFFVYFVICLFQRVTFFDSRGVTVKIKANRTIFYNLFFILVCVVALVVYKTPISYQLLLTAILPGAILGFLYYHSSLSYINKVSK